MRDDLMHMLWCTGFSQSHKFVKLVKIAPYLGKKLHLRVQKTRIFSVLTM